MGGIILPPASSFGIFGADTASVDAFGRLRVSHPFTVFDSTFQMDLAPLIYEQTVTGTGGIAHTAVDACATLSTTAGGVGTAQMQSYRYIRYQPGKSQLVKLTCALGAAAANVTRQIGIFDDSNGLYLEQTGASTVNICKITTSSGGAETIPQASWNIDPFNGSGRSGITLNLAKTQILVIDAQWLGVGRARIGFAINGLVYWAHEFRPANSLTAVYTTTLNLPVRAKLTTTAAVAATMCFICAAVESEGGVEDTASYQFTTNTGSVTAASGADTYMIALQPRTTFNSIVNRTQFTLREVELIVTGANPVLWKLCVGQALTGTSYANVNTTYSAMNQDTAGALSGSPAVVIDSGFVAATAANRLAEASKVSVNYPITLNAAGAVRDLGTLVMLVQGIGGASACRGKLTWGETR